MCYQPMFLNFSAKIGFVEAFYVVKLYCFSDNRAYLRLMKVVHHDNCPLCGATDIGFLQTVKDHSISQESFPLWRCKACSFTFTQNAPAPEMIGAYYKSENYISHSDTKTGLVNRLYHSAREYMLGRKHQLLDSLTKGKKVLDYGTGTGYFVDYLQRKGYEVEGVEIDEDARNYGSQKFGIEIHPPIFFEQEAREGSYDAITMWHVLEHLYDPLFYLRRSSALLKSNGYLLVAVPNLTSADAQHFGADWAAYDVPRHLWHFSPETLEKISKQAGFELQQTLHMPMDPFYVSIMSAKYQGAALPLLRGLWEGGYSFLQSLKKPSQGSSVIYVLRKKVS